MLAPQVEARSGRQVALFLTVEDGLHVDDPPPTGLEGDTGPAELGHQHR